MLNGFLSKIGLGKRFMSIRFKVILPYLLLTLLVAATGAYVVTRLVTNTLQERLTNQILDAGRIVSDEMVKQDIANLKAARQIAYTRGFAEAVRDKDQAAALSIARPTMSGLGVESVIVVNAEGRDLLHLRQQADGSIVDTGPNPPSLSLSIIQTLLSEKNPDSLPRRQFGIHPDDGRQYYFSAIPIVVDDQMVGVILAGTSLNTLLPRLKNTSLADVTFYKENGVAIASTFLPADAAINDLLLLSLSPDEYKQALTSDGVVHGETFQHNQRDYSSARAPLLIGEERVGVFSVALPLNFIIQSSSVSRNTYVVIYFFAMLLVILVGYAISRLIINPLYSLVRASRAIAAGDLQQRTNIKTRDEIGVLAKTFDEMTERLQQRTLELEKTNNILQQMDQTKGRFIHISAHELRTPLTLIMGYAAMLEQKASKDPDTRELVKGILEGSNRMTEIVDSMLDVSRIDSNTLTIKKTDLQIHLVIQKVRKAFQFALEERRLKFEALDLERLPSINADPELLFKVFYHVIMNAIKYTPDGGMITVQGRMIQDGNDSEVEVAVKDTGIGIDPQSHELIFNKFYQTGEVLFHSSSKTNFKGGGPGLGLSIARGIIEAHQGRIWVESPGHDETACPGSTFHIRLPVKDREK